MAQKKKKETAQVSPRAPRYHCTAEISISGFDGRAILDNISIGGFCMMSRTFAALVQNESYMMKITPEKETFIPAFQLEVEVRWVKSSATIFCAGFLVKKGNENRSFKEYVDYLKTRRDGEPQK